MCGALFQIIERLFTDKPLSFVWYFFFFLKMDFDQFFFFRFLLSTLFKIITAYKTSVKYCQGHIQANTSLGSES